VSEKYLRFDESTGNITDANGMFVYCAPFNTFKALEISKSSNVDDLIKLKNAGFTASEIVEIKKAGLA